MARIEPINYENATEEIKAAHDEHLKKSKLNNMKRTLLHNVTAFNALMVCSSIFKSFLDEQGVDFDSLVLSPVQQALISFGRNVADNPHEVFDDQMDELKEFFTDEQIVVITSLAAMMVASNIINTVLDVDL